VRVSECKIDSKTISLTFVRSLHLFNSECLQFHAGGSDAGRVGGSRGGCDECDGCENFPNFSNIKYNIRTTVETIEKLIVLLHFENMDLNVILTVGLLGIIIFYI